MRERAGVSLGEARSIRSTDAALLVKLKDGDKELWVPQSQIHDDSEVWKVGQEGNFVISEWFAEKKGLI